MNQTRPLNFLLLVFVALALFSCRSKKNVVYLQGADNYGGSGSVENYEAVIQPDDILSITIGSQSPEAAEPFNQKTDQNLNSSSTNNTLRGYLVDKDGFIEFPVLGKMKVAGLNRTELIEMLREKLQPYLTDAMINLRIINFKVTVLGEVNRPGAVEARSDRLTILEAIAQAGDLTIQGLRKNVLIIRDNQGQKTYARVDLTDAKLVDSPYYYLKQNDVVYIEPRRAKYDATALGPYLTSVASILSLAITVTLLILRL